MGTEQLGAAVGRVGVGVHDAAGHLDQFAYMAHQQHLFKPGRGCHIQRISDEVGGLDHRDGRKGRVGVVQVVQPVVARGKDEPLWGTGPQNSLVHFQLDGVQDGLLAHGLHDAAGAQHRKAALHPDVRVEGAPGHFLAVLDGNGHRKAAGITGGFSLPAQGLGNHLPGHMVDGGSTNGLVEAGFGHPAYTSAAVDADVRAARQQLHCDDHRQAGGHIHVVAAVLFNGAFGPSVGAAAEQGCYLHHDAFWRAQGHRLRRMAGEQQPGRARCPQRRTGAGGIAAAQ